MRVRLGINGFGRIGRTVLRAALSKDYRETLAVSQINDLMPVDMAIHLLKYDSVHGTLPFSVERYEEDLVVGGERIPYSRANKPHDIAWKEVDIVLECSGVFLARKQAEGHLSSPSQAGATAVIISAPAQDEDITVVYGVNSHLLDAGKHTIISNASCTTNCLAPPLKVIHDRFGVVKGWVSTVHAYTGDQRLLDLGHKDLRRGRAAALNIVPTSTGAARALSKIIPELSGRVDGIAIRVPTPNVSLVDMVIEVEKRTSAEEVNRALKEVSENEMQGVLACASEPLVSSDFNGNPASSVVDMPTTSVLEGRLLKLLCWYDNECGFSYRMLDVAKTLS